MLHRTRAYIQPHNVETCMYTYNYVHAGTDELLLRRTCRRYGLFVPRRRVLIWVRSPLTVEVVCAIPSFVGRKAYVRILYGKMMPVHPVYVRILHIHVGMGIYV